MDLQQFYKKFRTLFPVLALAVDRHYEDSLYGGFDDENQRIQPAWFECLADVLNKRMGNPEYRDEMLDVFKFCDSSFCSGQPDVKECIDVCFVENLFHGVTRQVSKSVWPTLPKKLQQMYKDIFRYSLDPF